MTRDVSEPDESFGANRVSSDGVNAALIYNDGDIGFLDASLAALPGRGDFVVVSDDPGFLPDLPEQTRLDYAAAGLDEVPVRFDPVRARIAEAAAGLGPGGGGSSSTCGGGWAPFRPRPISSAGAGSATSWSRSWG